MARRSRVWFCCGSMSLVYHDFLKTKTPQSFDPPRHRRGKLRAYRVEAFFAVFVFIKLLGSAYLLLAAQFAVLAVVIGHLVKSGEANQNVDEF